MLNNLALWFLGVSIGMIFADGNYLAAALGVIATLFCMTKHFEDCEETIYLDEGEIEDERKNDVS